MSSNKEATEEALASKFVKVLNQQFERKLSEPESGPPNDFPDFYSYEMGTRLSIELTRVVSPAEGKYFSDTYTYGNQIVDELQDKLHLLRGVCVTIFLRDTNQVLPSPKSSDGRLLSRSLAAYLNDHAAKLQELNLNIRFNIARCSNLKWDGPGGHGPYLTLLCHRYAMPEVLDAPLDIRFGPPSARTEEVNRRLFEAIQNKIRKSYPDGEHIILVAWEVARLSFDEVLMQLGTQALSEAGHPFKEVWYFYPLAEDSKAPQGILKKLWPAEGD